VFERRDNYYICLKPSDVRRTDGLIMRKTRFSGKDRIPMPPL
jgi:hypothetical protein